MSEITVSSWYKHLDPHLLESGIGWLSQVGDVKGAWIEIDFLKPVRKVGFINGFWEMDDRADWKWHHRIMRAALNGHSILMLDSQDEQIFHLAKPSEKVRLVVLDTYPSEKFNVVGLMGAKAL